MANVFRLDLPPVVVEAEEEAAVRMENVNLLSFQVRGSYIPSANVDCVGIINHLPHTCSRALAVKAPLVLRGHPQV